MPKRIDVHVDGPDGMPTWQAPESVRREFEGLDEGDVVHMVLKGKKKELYDSFGLPQIHGAVERKHDDGKADVFSTYFVMLDPEFRKQKGYRTFSVEDIELIVTEPAEEYIPQATDGQFQYGGKAVVTIEGGRQIEVRVAALFDGIMMGFTADNQPVSGGLNFFEPVK